MPCCGVDIQDGVPISGGGANASPNQGAIVQNIAPAGPVGSTDNRVLLFNDATIQLGSVAPSTWLSRVNSATLGTVLTITEAGWYHCFLAVPWASGQNVQLAISKDATAAQRQSGVAMDFNAPELYGGEFKFATTIQGTNCYAMVPISSADIAAGDNTIRALAANPNTPGAAVAGAAFVNGPVSALRIQRVAPIGD